MKHKTGNKQANLNVCTQASPLHELTWFFENIVTCNISEMLWKVIPHFSSRGAVRPSAVSVCSHPGDFYSLCIPKRIRKIFKT